MFAISDSETVHFPNEKMIANKHEDWIYFKPEPKVPDDMETDHLVACGVVIGCPINVVGWTGLECVNR